LGQQIALLECLATGIQDEKIYKEMHKVLQDMGNERMERDRQIRIKAIDGAYLAIVAWLNKNGFKLTPAAYETICDDLINSVDRPERAEL